MKTKNTQTLYKEKTRPAFAESFGLTNLMAVPRVLKVVVNAGIGKNLKDQKKVDEVVESLTVITGQHAVFTQAKKAIAGFKIREGQEVGVRVTLHGKRLWDFLDRLVHVALPRVRDFRGIPQTAVDESGNLNIGIREHLVFPEIVAEKVQHTFGFQVTVVSTARNKKEGEALFRSLGFPIQTEVTPVD
jgi:large subunit ribosomal protein L5